MSIVTRSPNSEAVLPSHAMSGSFPSSGWHGLQFFLVLFSVLLKWSTCWTQVYMSLK